MPRKHDKFLKGFSAPDSNRGVCRSAHNLRAIGRENSGVHSVGVPFKNNYVVEIFFAPNANVIILANSNNLVWLLLLTDSAQPQSSAESNDDKAEDKDSHFYDVLATLNL